MRRLTCAVATTQSFVDQKVACKLFVELESILVAKKKESLAFY